jgi:hypothetical protein
MSKHRIYLFIEEIRAVPRPGVTEEEILATAEYAFIGRR